MMDELLTKHGNELIKIRSCFEGAIILGVKGDDVLEDRLIIGNVKWDFRERKSKFIDDLAAD